jgi:adenylyltransferase/sulfurtransferase
VLVVGGAPCYKGRMSIGRPPAELPPLSQEELRRYARQLVMPPIGETGQRRLKDARVLLVGAGGLGSPIALYLAAAGIGTLGIVEFDAVDPSNLQRQVLHGTPDVGRPKIASACDRLRGLNPNVRLEPHEGRLDAANVAGLVEAHDLVVDGTDNFDARFLMNDAAVRLGRPYVYGAVAGFEGQASVFCAPGGPCLRCLHPEPPTPGDVPTPAETGVLGAVPGMIGAIQAAEVVKLVTGAGEPLVGRILLVDALRMQFRTVRLKRAPGCAACGEGRSAS